VSEARAPHRRRRAAVAAVSFLTVVPIGRRSSGEDLRRGAALFPVVGAGIGALVAAVAWGAGLVLPADVASVLGVATGTILTAGLHLDGLADVADGIGASLGGAEPRTAMGDPRLGAFGVAALVLDLLLKTSVLSSLVTGGGYPVEVLAATSLGRLSPIVLAWRLPYGGPAGGTGIWTRGVGGRSVGVATVLAIAVAVPSAGVAATAAMLLAGAVAAGVLGAWARARLGGTSGDVLGAVAELTETLTLAVALAMASSS
jgi:adenosylcobinamide-GDP ribazoletransferase